MEFRTRILFLIFCFVLIWKIAVWTLFKISLPVCKCKSFFLFNYSNGWRKCLCFFAQADILFYFFFYFPEQCYSANCVTSIVILLIWLRIGSQWLEPRFSGLEGLKHSALAKLITARYTPSFLGYRTSDQSNLVGADATKQINTEAVRPVCATWF